jgi:glycosyl hydrolase family 26
MGHRRAARMLASLTVLALLGAAAACSGGDDRRRAAGSPGSARSPEAVATAAGPLSGGNVPVPAHGAYVGAWVNPLPSDYTQSGRLSAERDFEQQLGRPLDIVHTYRKFEEPFFTSSDLEFVRRGATLLFSWAGTDTRTIAAGRYDDLLRDRARRVRELDRPILLEWRWEMDRPNLQAEVWSGEDYVKAWRHIREVFAQQGVSNASWVWCPTADGFASGRAQSYYPGDDQVDWVCVDAYPGDTIRPMGDILRPFLEWAKDRSKPIVIGEYGCPRSLAPDERAAWLRDAAAVFRANTKIKAVLYFEANPTDRSSDRFHYQIRDDPPALEAFRQMVQDPYFNPRNVR